MSPARHSAAGSNSCNALTNMSAPLGSSRARSPAALRQRRGGGVTPAPHQAPGQGTGGLTVPVRDLSCDHGGAVAAGALQQPLAPGGQVVGHDGQLARQLLEVDDD